ncbi:MAG: hypothetical protein IMW89_05155 [Ktedonobacteraceae bacterium]|nr:hypothetical protein [Ktedonobacteraceae bacterium]
MNEEWVSMRAAAARLKAEGFRISPNKVSRLANRDKIRTRNDPLDERVRLVELNELRALFTQSLRNSRNDDEIDEFTDDSSSDDE